MNGIGVWITWRVESQVHGVSVRICGRGGE